MLVAPSELYMMCVSLRGPIDWIIVRRQTSSRLARLSDLIFLAPWKMCNTSYHILVLKNSKRGNCESHVVCTLSTQTCLKSSLNLDKNLGRNNLPFFGHLVTWLESILATYLNGQNCLRYSLSTHSKYLYVGSAYRYSKEFVCI